MAANPVTIRHAIPQVGLQQLTLFPPADMVYRRLRNREMRRLVSLRHLGALSHAFPGARHARWDYTVAMLYFANALRVPGMNSRFRIGRIQFSSSIAALQALSLTWNIGHLPGTFSVEKGVYRHLHALNPDDPAANLEWPYRANPAVALLQKSASRLLLAHDYLALARVLAVTKLLSLAPSDTDDLFHLTVDFAAPFLLDTLPPSSIQWPKIGTAFRLIRHLAYLTIDAPFTGLGWALSVPDFLSSLLAQGNLDLDAMHATVSEVLSPIERATFEVIYHSPEARRECAMVADLVESHLSQHPNSRTEIQQWLRAGLFQQLRLGNRSDPRRFHSLGTLRLRSHFTSFPHTPVAQEADLKAKGFPLPVAFTYRAWNSDVLLEPDESILEAFTAAPTSSLVGKLLLWLLSNCDDLESPIDDPLTLFQKSDLEPSYISLLDRGFRIRYPDMTIRVRPWRLKAFGLFPDHALPADRGAAWASGPRINDPVASHLLRDRANTIPLDLRSSYAELVGIRALRAALRRSWTQKELRQRWLLLTASIELHRAGGTVMEIDGGLLRVSTRSGRMTLYALETKKGGENPQVSLSKRLKKAGIAAESRKLGVHHAYASIPL